MFLGMLVWGKMSTVFRVVGLSSPTAWNFHAVRKPKLMVWRGCVVHGVAQGWRGRREEGKSPVSPQPSQLRHQTCYEEAILDVQSRGTFR